MVKLASYILLLVVISFSVPSLVSSSAQVSTNKTKRLHAKLSAYSVVISYSSNLARNINSNSHVIYDSGKHYEQIGDFALIWYEADPNIAWRLDFKTRKAYLNDSRFTSLNRLAQLIKSNKLDGVSRISGYSQSTLEKFAIMKPHAVQRLLSKSLLHIDISSNELSIKFKKLGNRLILGRQCSIFESIQGPAIKYWVDAATGYVLKYVETYVPANPRSKTSTVVHEITRITINPSIDPKQFQIPSGFKVILPRILSRIALPEGVIPELMTGKDSYLGIDLIKEIEVSEEYERRNGEVARKELGSRKGMRK